MMFPISELAEVATLNPRLQAKLDPADAVSFVSMADLSAENGAVVSEQIRTYGQVAKGYTPFSHGDLLFAKITPCFENNKIGHAKLSRPVGFGSTEFHVIRARPGLTDPRYLLHYLRQDHIRAEGERKMTGSAGQRRVPIHFLTNLPIPVPPLAEQLRIAAILDQADALRSKRQAVLIKLNEMVRSLFVEMFGDPFSSGRHPLLPLVSVAQLINGDRSSNYPSGDDLLSDGVVFLNTKNISGSHVSLSGCNFISEGKFQSLSRGKLRRHDLIITLRGTLGQCAEFDCAHDTGFINAQMMIIRPGEAILPTYLREFIVHPSTQARLMLNSSGSAVPQLTGQEVGAMRVSIAPLKEQRLFTDRVIHLRSVIANAAEHSTSLDALFASLQHRAFRGEL